LSDEMQDFAGAYGECMYRLDMAIRPEALPTDAVALTEMVLALDAENENLRVAMLTLKDMIFGKRSERLAVEIDDYDERGHSGSLISLMIANSSWISIGEFRKTQGIAIEKKRNWIVLRIIAAAIVILFVFASSR
jgi:hypothetical protein